MSLNWLLRSANFAHDAVAQTFAPSPNATPRQIRINGAACIGIGMLSCVTFGAGLIAMGPYLGKAGMMILLLPTMFAYASLIIGGYRLVFGASGKNSSETLLASLGRVIFGTAWIIFVFAALMGGAYLLFAALESNTGETASVFW